MKRRFEGELAKWAPLQASIGGWVIVALGIALLTLRHSQALWQIIPCPTSIRGRVRRR
jgi:hypothetical protein